MQNKITWTILSLVAAALLVIAWRGMTAPDLNLQPKSRIWVNGTSNVRNFECDADAMTVLVQTNTADAVRAVADGKKAVGKVEVRVPVATMDCKNGTMNGHMKDALNANAHPVIAFTLASYDLVKAGDSVGVTLNGTLDIGGTTKPVTISGEATDVGDGVLHLTGESDVHMKEFGLKPPSLMMGMMKVNETVHVYFDLLLKSAGSAQ